MKVSDVLTSLPRDAISLLVRAHLMPASTLVWYDLYRFFQSLPETMARMERYARTAEHCHMTEDGARHIINKLDRYV